MKQEPSMYDVALKAGVSKSTVSRALSEDHKNVSKETLEKIVKIAEEMGYKINPAASNLRSNRSRIIGLVIPELVTTFYVNFINYVQTKLYEMGFQMMLAICNEDPKVEREHLLRMQETSVEGIVISTCHNSQNVDIYTELLENGTPLIFFDRTIDKLSTPKVKIDDYVKSFLLMEHLILTGRKNIVHLTGPAFIQNTHERIRAYKEALSKHGLPVNPDYIIDSGINFEDGIRSMECFIQKKLPFDAVFCFTETTALGAKSFLQDLQYSIPKDVAICCISGTKLSTLVHPTLTVVEQPVVQMAEKCIEFLKEKLKDPSAPNREIVLEAEMICRSST